MAAGPEWGERTARRLRRIKQQYIADCVKAGKATQAELDARQALKQTMQAEGTEVEYLRSADEICALMRLAGFEEASIVWRWAADTILVGYKA
jgi:hypothetical protein